MAVNGIDIGVIQSICLVALKEYDENRSGTIVAPTTPVRRLEVAADEVLAKLQDIIITVETNQKRWVASGITALLADTLDGDVVEGGTYDKERWEELQAAYTSFATWLQTPIEEGGKTPGQVIFRDYVPPTQE